jgi:hypothetical protein
MESQSSRSCDCYTIGSIGLIKRKNPIVHNLKSYQGLPQSRGLGSAKLVSENLFNPAGSAMAMAGDISAVIHSNVFWLGIGRSPIQFSIQNVLFLGQG